MKQSLSVMFASLLLCSLVLAPSSYAGNKLILEGTLKGETGHNEKGELKSCSLWLEKDGKIVEGSKEIFQYWEFKAKLATLDRYKDQKVIVTHHKDTKNTYIKTANPSVGGSGGLMEKLAPEGPELIIVP